MEKYVPTKDLPEDIKVLPREETRCQFCGVSYLIHHEVKRLEETISTLETQLKICNGRLQKMEEERNTTARECGHLREQLREKEELYLSLESQLKEVENERASAVEESRRLGLTHKLREEQLSALNSRLESLQLEVTQLEEENRSSVTSLSNNMEETRKRSAVVLSFLSAYSATQRSLECSMKNQVRELGKYFQKASGELLKECQAYSARQREDFERRSGDLRHKFASERAKAEENHFLAIEEMKTTISGLQSQVKATGVERAAVVSESMLLKEENRSLKGQVSQLRTTTDTHQAELADLCNRLSASRKELVSKEQKMKNFRQLHEEELNKYKQLLAEASQKLSAFENEREEREQLHRYNTQQLLKKHSQEMKVLQRSLQAECSQTVEDVTRATQEESQRKITELMRQCDEQTIVAGKLKEELRKEKMVFDAEIERNLNQVRELEMRLQSQASEASRESQRTRAVEEQQKKALEEHARAVEEHKRAVGKAKLEREEVQERLSDAYKEIKLLQGTVERECEERERLVKALQDSKLKIHVQSRAKTPK